MLQIPADYICSACERAEREEIIVIRLEEQVSFRHLRQVSSDFERGLFLPGGLRGKLLSSGVYVQRLNCNFCRDLTGTGYFKSKGQGLV